MSGGFEALGLMPELLQSVSELGWNLPTGVQDESIPLILGGGDVMVASETGTGKTAAFCLPIIQCVHERLREVVVDVSKKKTGPQDVRLSDIDRDAILSITSDGLHCSSTANQVWAGARATHGVKSGKYYFEATIQGSGICRLGWSSMAAHLELGKDSYGFGYGGTGKKSVNNTYEDYGLNGVKYGDNDAVGCYLDWGEMTISYSKNGVYLGVAFNIPESMIGSVLFPAIVLKGGGALLNFGGGKPFKSVVQDTVLVGFNSLFEATLVDIVDASSKEAFAVKGKRLPLAIIIEPAKELAEQVYQNIKSMAQHVIKPELKVELFIGGDDTKKQKQSLKAGVDIVVGTTGKLCDLLNDKSLDLSQVRFFVLDEADRLVDGDNYQKVLQLYAACPSGGNGENRLQVSFFSATLHSDEVTNLANKICVNPTWVDLKGVDSVPDTVHHVVYRVDPVRDSVLLLNATGKARALTDGVHTDGHTDSSSKEEKNSQLVKEIKLQVLLGIIDKFQMSQCMIFCRTNQDCDNLETFLCYIGGEGRKFTEKIESGKENPYSCCVLAGMRSMNERRQNLEAFRDGDVRFLICTDLAARGIDIKGLPFMVNMTLPDKAEQYIHRIGRVGRAERYGLAISLVAGDDIKEKVWYHTCQSKGRSCSNRTLTTDGGCCVWYDEPELLESVEERIHSPIATMDGSYELPVHVSSLGAVYGEEIKQVGGVANLHTASIGPILKELRVMEDKAQNNFLLMQSQFSVY